MEANSSSDTRLVPKTRLARVQDGLKTAWGLLGHIDDVRGRLGVVGLAVAAMGAAAVWVGVAFTVRMSLAVVGAVSLASMALLSLVFYLRSAEALASLRHQSLSGDNLPKEGRLWQGILWRRELNGFPEPLCPEDETPLMEVDWIEGEGLGVPRDPMFYTVLGPHDPEEQSGTSLMCPACKETFDPNQQQTYASLITAAARVLRGKAARSVPQGAAR